MVTKYKLVSKTSGKEEQVLNISFNETFFVVATATQGVRFETAEDEDGFNDAFFLEEGVAEAFAEETPVAEAPVVAPVEEVAPVAETVEEALVGSDTTASEVAPVEETVVAE